MAVVTHETRILRSLPVEETAGARPARQSVHPEEVQTVTSPEITHRSGGLFDRPPYFVVFRFCQSSRNLPTKFPSSEPSGREMTQSISSASGTTYASPRL